MMRALTRNLPWKALAFFSAVGLWYMIAGESEVATSVPVVVQYRHAPADLEISSDHPERLFLKLRGPASRLSASELTQTSLSLDLGNVHSPGEQTFTVNDSNLGLPAGVHLIRVVPSQVRLVFERRAERHVPVQVQYSSPAADGYRIAREDVQPRTVRVVGPESRLQRLELVTTDPVDLSSKVGVAEFRVPVFIQDPQLRFEPPAPVAVVRVTLEKIPQ